MSPNSNNNMGSTTRTSTIIHAADSNGLGMSYFAMIDDVNTLKSSLTTETESSSATGDCSGGTSTTIEEERTAANNTSLDSTAATTPQRPGENNDKKKNEGHDLFLSNLQQVKSSPTFCEKMTTAQLLMTVDEEEGGNANYDQNKKNEEREQFILNLQRLQSSATFDDDGDGDINNHRIQVTSNGNGDVKNQVKHNEEKEEEEEIFEATKISPSSRDRREVDSSLIELQLGYKTNIGENKERRDCFGCIVM